MQKGCSVILEFLDLSTLPERLKNQDMLEMEYRMKDGNWHSFHFIAKKEMKTERTESFESGRKIEIPSV